MLQKSLLGLSIIGVVVLVLLGIFWSQSDTGGEASILGLGRRLQDASARNAGLCIEKEPGCIVVSDCSQLGLLLPERALPEGHQVEKKPIATWQVATCTLTHIGTGFSFNVRVTGTSPH